MPESEATTEVKQIFSKHVIEKGLTNKLTCTLVHSSQESRAPSPGPLLAIARPKNPGGYSFRNQQSFGGRGAFNGQRGDFNGQRDCGVEGHPYYDYKFRSYGDLIAYASSDYMISNMIVDPDYYKFQLDRAEEAGKKATFYFSGECYDAERRLDAILQLANEDGKAYDFLIGAEKKKGVALQAELETLQAELEEDKERELSLENQKLMTTGKAKAFVYVGKKALRNLSQVHISDKQDLVVMERMRKNWNSPVLLDEMKWLQSGLEVDVARILANMKAGADSI